MNKSTFVKIRLFSFKFWIFFKDSSCQSLELSYFRNWRCIQVNEGVEQMDEIFIATKEGE